MRQQTRLFNHAARDMFKIGEGAVEAQFSERRARRGVTCFRLIAEGEQHFLATGRGALARNFQHVIGR